MILPESVCDCANHALNELRKLTNKNILPDTTGEDLLAMRARLMHLNEPSQISANASCHLLPTRDQQWIALNLSRASDWELLPALFKNASTINTWEQVTAQANKSHAENLLEQGRTLGLAVALAQQKFPTDVTAWFDIICSGEKRKTKNNDLLVLDLSSLWAGPLCSQLLQQSGARVIKVESKQRPDGMRVNANQGAQEFYNWLNQDKELIALDFSAAKDIQQLKQLIIQADIVIEGSRPRALRQLGIDAEHIVKQQPGLIWISITGYGRREPQSNWIAFGDDAAVSAGLFDVIGNKPSFIGDAIADPLTGLHAALAAQTFWQSGEAVLLDVNLHTIARHAMRLSR